MRSRPMAAWFGSRFAHQFWRVLFHPPLVLMELGVSYFVVPELTRKYDAVTASVLGLGGWLLIGALWATTRAVRGRLLSFEGAIGQLRPIARAVNIDIGDNSPAVVLFANELIELLNSAGWDARHTGTWISVDPRPEGIEIIHRQDEAPNPYVKLRDVLQAMGYRARTSIWEGEREGGMVDGENRRAAAATIVIGMGF